MFARTNQLVMFLLLFFVVHGPAIAQPVNVTFLASGECPDYAGLSFQELLEAIPSSETIHCAVAGQHQAISSLEEPIVKSFRNREEFETSTEYDRKKKVHNEATELSVREFRRMYNKTVSAIERLVYEIDVPVQRIETYDIEQQCFAALIAQIDLRELYEQQNVGELRTEESPRGLRVIQPTCMRKIHTHRDNSGLLKYYKTDGGDCFARFREYLYVMGRDQWSGGVSGRVPEGRNIRRIYNDLVGVVPVLEIASRQLCVEVDEAKEIRSGPLARFRLVGEVGFEHNSKGYFNWVFDADFIDENTNERI